MARCAHGAIRDVCLDVERREVSGYLRCSINHYLGSDYVSLVVWNDRPRRTHTQVVQAFDRAIEDVPKS